MHSCRVLLWARMCVGRGALRVPGRQVRVGFGIDVNGALQWSQYPYLSAKQLQLKVSKRKTWGFLTGRKVRQSYALLL